MKKLRLAILVALLGVVACGFYVLGYRKATKEHTLFFGDVNDVSFEYIDFRTSCR